MIQNGRLSDGYTIGALALWRLMISTKNQL